MTPSPDALLSTVNIMALFKVSSRTVYRWVRDGKLHSVRVGRQHRFRVGDVASLVERPPTEIHELTVLQRLGIVEVKTEGMEALTLSLLDQITSLADKQKWLIKRALDQMSVETTHPPPQNSKL